MRNIALLACLVFAMSACSSKEQAKKIRSLQASLSDLDGRCTKVKAERDKLSKQVQRLQNQFLVYKKRPCDYQLDEQNFTIEKKNGMGTPSTPGMTTPGMVVRRPVGPGMVGPRPMVPTGPKVDLSAVPRRLKRSYARFKRCYESAGKKNPSLQGSSRRVKLKFTVLTSGRVTGVRVVPPIGFGFEGCVRGIFYGWRFNAIPKSRNFYQWITLRLQ